MNASNWHTCARSGCRILVPVGTDECAQHRSRIDNFVAPVNVDIRAVVVPRAKLHDGRTVIPGRRAAHENEIRYCDQPDCDRVLTSRVQDTTCPACRRELKRRAKRQARLPRAPKLPFDPDIERAQRLIHLRKPLFESEARPLLERYSELLRDVIEGHAPVSCGARFLAVWMREHAFPARQFARTLDVEHSTVARWLRGTYRPRIATRARIEKITEGAVPRKAWRKPWEAYRQQQVQQNG